MKPPFEVKLEQTNIKRHHGYLGIRKGLLGLEGVTLYYYKGRFQFLKNIFKPFLVITAFLKRMIVNKYHSIHISTMSYDTMYSKKQAENDFWNR